VLTRRFIYCRIPLRHRPGASSDRVTASLFGTQRMIGCIHRAERLTDIQPSVDTYRFRPPYIQDLCFIDQDGMPSPII
jgi:hypothetical protein